MPAKPPKSPGLDLHYSVNVTKEDKELLDRASAVDDEPKTSRWIRKVSLRAARELLGERKGTK